MINKDQYTRNFLKSAGMSVSDALVEEKTAEWWYNLRRKDSGGLRLTEAMRSQIHNWAELLEIDDLAKADSIWTLEGY
jgi:hypothetical protein